MIPIFFLSILLLILIFGLFIAKNNTLKLVLLLLTGIVGFIITGILGIVLFIPDYNTLEGMVSAMLIINFFFFGACFAILYIPSSIYYFTKKYKHLKIKSLKLETPKKNFLASEILFWFFFNVLNLFLSVIIYSMPNPIKSSTTVSSYFNTPTYALLFILFVMFVSFVIFRRNMCPSKKHITIFGLLTIIMFFIFLYCFNFLT